MTLCNITQLPAVLDLSEAVQMYKTWRKIKSLSKRNCSGSTHVYSSLSLVFCTKKQFVSYSYSSLLIGQENHSGSLIDERGVAQSRHGWRQNLSPTADTLCDYAPLPVNHLTPTTWNEARSPLSTRCLANFILTLSKVWICSVCILKNNFKNPSTVSIAK